MKVRIQSPLATMTADLTNEQICRIFGQVIEWVSETEEEPETIEADSSGEKDDDSTASEIPETAEPQEESEADLHTDSRGGVNALNEQEVERYKGFLYIRCPECGTARGFNPKESIRKFVCKNCNHVAELKGLKLAEVFCTNCGGQFRYRTNIQDDDFIIECLNCKSPVDMVLHPTKTKYIALSQQKW